MKTSNLVRKNLSSFLLLVFTGSFLFNMVFWQEKVALNLVLFALFSIAAICWLYRDAFKNSNARWMLVAVAVSFTMLIIYNSAISEIVSITALILLAAYSKYRLRSPVYAAGSTAESFLQFIPQFLLCFNQLARGKKWKNSWIKSVRITIIPILLMLVFFFMYRRSSNVFTELTDRFADTLGSWVEPVLNWFEPQRILFLLLGFLLTGGLLNRKLQSAFQQAEATKTDVLLREKRSFKISEPGIWQSFVQIFTGRQASGSMALKYEYKAGIISLVILNSLLLVVNMTDIVYLWMGREFEPGFAWAGYVHEGAEMLVFSILMAMLVVLFFFRGNLNFFKEKKPLLLTSYIWLLQNFFLAASVCLRNYYYIIHMTLAYKRIGLYVFVLLVLIGLISVFLKIRFVKSSYYLLKFNAVAAFSMLVLSSFVQWDVLIARYNLSHTNEVPVDTAFLLTLSDHALPVLQQHRDFFSRPQTVQQKRFDPGYEGTSQIEILDRRINNFLRNQQHYTWLSWNRADAQTVQQLQYAIRLAQHE